MGSTLVEDAWIPLVSFRFNTAASAKRCTGTAQRTVRGKLSICLILNLLGFRGQTTCMDGDSNAFEPELWEDAPYLVTKRLGASDSQWLEETFEGKPSDPSTRKSP